MEKSVVAVSGGFDPLHFGHTDHLDEAMKLGNALIVILTRDDHLKAKDLASDRPLGKPFLTYEERAYLLNWGLRGKIKYYEVVPNIDKDITSCDSLRAYKPNIFAKGGDSWNMKSLPEYEVCKELGIQIVFGIGGLKKKQGSRILVERAIENYNRLTSQK